MNASNKSVIIAMGISLYAELMNLPQGQAAGSTESKQWLQWAERYPQWTHIVKRYQEAIFEECLGL